MVASGLAFLGTLEAGHKVQKLLRERLPGNNFREDNVPVQLSKIRRLATTLVHLVILDARVENLDWGLGLHVVEDEALLCADQNSLPLLCKMKQ